MIKQFTIPHIKTKNKPGILCPLKIQDINQKIHVDFTINNLFYITDLNSLESRGKHANTNTEEILICIKGSFNLECFDGKNKYNYTLKEHDAVYIPKMVWLDFNNFKECIILVLTSITPVIEKESIHDIDEFIKLKNS
tara:strand:- start:13 stop:426 length:414 start_codon:yes stop_codon:yes gene_type:complete